MRHFIVIPANSEVATHFVSSLRPPSWILEVTAWREIQFVKGGGVVARTKVSYFSTKILDFRSSDVNLQAY